MGTTGVVCITHIAAVADHFCHGFIRREKIMADFTEITKTVQESKGEEKIAPFQIDGEMDEEQEFYEENDGMENPAEDEAGCAEESEVKKEPEKQDAEEERKRAEHEAAEAKRKAEWEEKQQAKKAREQAALQELSAMSDADVMTASMNRVGADTERLTRRNMKQCVTEHIQTLCLSDPVFARLVMHPRKSMVNCFHFINRKARDFVKQEMEDNDEKPDGNGIYGSDVPDDLCYQWAEEYFRDPDAKEDEVKEEKFVPKPYIGKSGSSKAKKSEKKTKKEPVKEKKAPEKEQEVNIPGQISLLDLVGQEAKAG